MNKKYELLQDDTVKFREHTLYRIKTLLNGVSHTTQKVSCSISMVISRGKRGTIDIHPLPAPENSAPSQSSPVEEAAARMIYDVTSACTMEDMQKITANEKFNQRREKLKNHYSELAQKLGNAVQEALARFETVEYEGEPSW